MLYKIVDLHLPPPDAMGAEFTHLSSLVGLIRKFDRAAVLAYMAGLEKIGRINGDWVPNLEIKVFKIDQIAEAEAWLTN
jgi:hypothetical protein